MPDKITTAIDRLNNILPLKSRQQKLPSEIQQLYRNILDAYIQLGRSLNKKELAAINNAGEACDILQKNDMVILDNAGKLVGAYPFTMEKRHYKVSFNNHSVYSMCALDSLAISSMYNIEVKIESRCHITAAAIEIYQQGKTLIKPSNNADIYLGINWNAASQGTACANSLCTEMIFLKQKNTALKWLNEQADQRQIFTLDEAIAFAAGFFTPLLD